MGVQITVDKDDLLEAGWAISYESDEMPDLGRVMVARKVVDGQSFCFVSYVKDALCGLQRMGQQCRAVVALGPVLRAPRRSLGGVT